MLLDFNKPVAIGKIGSSECRAVYATVEDNQMTNLDYHDIFIGAGVFPPTVPSLEDFATIFTYDLKDMDTVAKWMGDEEDALLKRYCPDAKLVTLRELEPYYWEESWSKGLEHKKVLVISPFADTITKQYEKRGDLWKREDILPPFTLKTIKCPLSWYLKHGDSAQLPTADSWMEELSRLKQKMEKESFDVCLVGAGAWSIPLAVHAKRLNKIGIHLGGSLQILFGIKGKRWDEHDVISAFYNDAWVRPSEKETPTTSFKVEGGCYW